MPVVAMTVESDTSTGRLSPAVALSATRRVTTDGSASAVDIADIIRRLPDHSPCHVACAPGRLDVMGGLADYTGSLVLFMPLAVGVCVAVQRSADGMLTILPSVEESRASREPFSIEVSRLFESDARSVVSTVAGSPVQPGHVAPACSIVGAIAESIRAALVPTLAGGLSIAFGSELLNGRDNGKTAALAAATITALADACESKLDLANAAAVCQRVENEWLGKPVGIGDAVCVLGGLRNTISAVRCEPCIPRGDVELTEGFVVLGIDCSVDRPDEMQKYEYVRTAAFMGRALIDRIIRHDGGDAAWSGYLSHVSIADYVSRFRDRLPTSLKGSEYLKRFGETGDPLTRVHPDYSYKIRSRTEHHIYEHARASQFFELLTRSVEKGDNRALVEAGELMYASQWSYGQRCGLGGVETDFLVSTLREQGVDHGIYGAKITGRGCGAMVAVLMQATEQAQVAIDSAVRATAEKFGVKPLVLRGSSPGALVGGVQKV